MRTIVTMFDSAILAAQEDTARLLAFIVAIATAVVIAIVIDRRAGKDHLLRFITWVYVLMAIEFSIEIVLDDIHRSARGHLNSSDSVITIFISYLGYVLLIIFAPPLQGFILWAVTVPFGDYLAALGIVGEALAFAVPIATIICLWRRHVLNRRQAR